MQSASVRVIVIVIVAVTVSSLSFSNVRLFVLRHSSDLHFVILISVPRRELEELSTTMKTNAFRTLRAEI